METGEVFPPSVDPDRYSDTGRFSSLLTRRIPLVIVFLSWAKDRSLVAGSRLDRSCDARAIVQMSASSLNLDMPNPPAFLSA